MSCSSATSSSDCPRIHHRRKGMAVADGHDQLMVPAVLRRPLGELDDRRRQLEADLLRRVHPTPAVVLDDGLDPQSVGPETLDEGALARREQAVEAELGAGGAHDLLDRVRHGDLLAEGLALHLGEHGATGQCREPFEHPSMLRSGPQPVEWLVDREDSAQLALLVVQRSNEHVHRVPRIRGVADGHGRHDPAALRGTARATLVRHELQDAPVLRELELVEHHLHGDARADPCGASGVHDEHRARRPAGSGWRPRQSRPPPQFRRRSAGGSPASVSATSQSAVRAAGALGGASLSVAVMEPPRDILGRGGPWTCGTGKLRKSGVFAADRVGPLRAWRGLSLAARMGWPGGRVTEGFTSRCRGRSGLHRTRWWVTPTRGDPRDQCHRKQTAVAPRSGGKGETVVQETTSAAGDRRG